MAEQNEKNSKTPEEEVSRGILDMGFFETIKWALLVGFCAAALTTGKEKLEQFGRWIDGETINPAVIAEEPMLPGSRTIKTDVLDMGPLQISIDKNWRTVESLNLNFIRNIVTHYKGIFDFSLGSTNEKSPFLLSTPKMYTVFLPNDAGHAFSLHQRVFLRVSIDIKDTISALDSLTEQQRKNTLMQFGSASPAPDQNVIVSGNIDKDVVSPDDIFDQALSSQLVLLSGMQNEGFSVNINHLSRSQIGSYTIAEIDYTYTMEQQEQRLRTTLYWHYKDGNPWGDLGIFYVDYNEKAAAKHKRAIKAMFSSLALKEGDQKIWTGQKSPASTDNQIMSFVGIEVDELKLKAMGLNIKKVEEILKSKIPTPLEDVQDIELISGGENRVLLRDIARIDPLSRHGQKIQDFNSIILTVTPRR
tara:strand:- start:56765 stop:58015 length:1251 start_codon:yes stop_codon:yes gene_type:complete